MPVNTRAKKFCPPLKSQPLSPALSSAPQSQESTANTGDSLPDTQTHTVLSYCDSYQAEEQPSTPLLCVEQPSTPLLCEDVPSNEDSLSSSNNSSLCSASEEIDENENIEQTSRFKPHKRDRLPVGYGYGILQHNQNKKKKTVADLERGTRGKKRVRISTPLAGVEKGKRLCGRDLSVYDYQPTPPEAGGVVKRQAVDVSGYCSSREEQVSSSFPQHSVSYFINFCSWWLTEKWLLR